jgi:AraC-like DNA-binding protein
MLRASTPAQYGLILIDLAERRGCSREGLLAGTTLAEADLSRVGARISEPDFARLASNAMALLQDPALGLKLGLRLNLGAHAVLGQAFMTCRDLAEAMALFLAYYHLLAPALHLELECSDDHWLLSLTNSAAGTPPNFNYELLCGAMLNTLRGLLGKPDLQLRLEVPYPEPSHGALYREIFGEEVNFDCVRGRVAFPRALLATPLPSSNPALRRLYAEECARLLHDLAGEDSVAEQTLRLLRKLEGQYPQMPVLAKMLNLSPRTYRRRLVREQSSFQSLLDRVRAEHATRHLQSSRLPLATIAYLVGFNDVSNFRRAYIRWTGHSPREVRNGH